jgi:GT2 family glycosyltransferase
MSLKKNSKRKIFPILESIFDSVQVVGINPKDVHLYAVAHANKPITFKSIATVHRFDADKDYKPELNAYWSELTCMEWMDSQCTQDFIGVANYRRCFTDEAIRATEEDVLYVPERFYLHQSVSEHWHGCHSPTYKIPNQTLTLARKNKLPLTEEMLSSFWNDNRLHPILMHYGNRELVKRYRDLLFECMLPIWEEHKDEYQHLQGYPQRWLGYLTERIQSAIIINAQHFFGDMKIKEAPMVLVENGKTQPFGGLAPKELLIQDEKGYHHFGQINTKPELEMEDVGAIELLATAVVNGHENLKRHYLSIDHPVERYVVVNNSQRKFPEVTEVLEEIFNNPNPHVHEVVIINNRFNAGYAGAINQIIRQNFDCNYWFITNDDWHVQPGELKRLAARLELDFVGLLCEEGELNGYSAFVMSDELVSKVGLMDENFYPAYCEDNDHRYRMKLAGLSWERYPLKASHVISSTLHSNEEFEKRNQYSFRQNIAYYIEKWGGDRGVEVFQTPFNSGAPIDYFPYRSDRMYSQQWL